jgi:phenylacetate-CoA ligase
MSFGLILKVLHHIEQLRKHEHWTREHLLAYQSDALRQQRAYAYAHSPFYQQFHKGLMDRPLHELPVLTKAMMMEHFDELVTERSLRLERVREHAKRDDVDARFLERYWVTATSGSSGHPGFFLFDEAEWVQLVASFARGQEWSGSKISLLRRQRMATVASTSAWHLSSQVANTAKSWWRPSIRIAASDALPSIVQRLNEWRPDILIAYASMARILADEQIEGRLHIQPEVIFTSSEVLTDETRRRSEAAWGHVPFNQYGATETANIAAECKGHRLHLYEDLLITEVVDENYQHVPVGEYGAHVLVTTLFSRTQPLIRYEMNDSIRLSADSCSCSLPFALMDSVQGRVEDALLLPGLSGKPVTIQPLVFNRIMDILPISGWQVVQEQDNTLSVLLAGNTNGIEDVVIQNQLFAALRDHGAAVQSIAVQHVTAIPKSSSGKAPLIKRLGNDDHSAKAISDNTVNVSSA